MLFILCACIVPFFSHTMAINSVCPHTPLTKNIQQSFPLTYTVSHSSLSWFPHNCSIDCTATDWLINSLIAEYIIFFNPLQIEWVKRAYEVLVLHNKTLNTSISLRIHASEPLSTHIHIFFPARINKLSHFKLQRNAFHSALPSSSVCGWIDSSLY